MKSLSPMKGVLSNKNQFRWTKNELDFLVKHYSELRPVEIAKALHRTLKSVQTKASRLGIRSRKFLRFFKSTVNPSPNLAYIMGAWMGDRTSSKYLAISVRDFDFAEAFRKAFIGAFGVQPIFTRFSDGRYMVGKGDINFVRWINSFSIWRKRNALHNLLQSRLRSKYYKYSSHVYRLAKSLNRKENLGPKSISQIISVPQHTVGNWLYGSSKPRLLKEGLTHHEMESALKEFGVKR